MLKGFLLEEPVLKYPNPNRPYVLYTDASKYAWAGVLTQAYTHAADRIEKEIHHPVTSIVDYSGDHRSTGPPWSRRLMLFTWPPESSITTFQIQIPQFAVTTCHCVSSC